MNEERIYTVLLGPHVSEKATLAADDDRQFVFRVARDANKLEIKKSVEKIFDVKVKNVRTVNVKGKTKRFGQTFGKRPDWKKAYVALHEGFDIEFIGAE